MPQQIVQRANPQKRMTQPAVAHIDFGRFDHPLALIAVPGLQAPHQQKIDHHSQLPLVIARHLWAGDPTVDISFH